MAGIAQISLRRPLLLLTLDGSKFSKVQMSFNILKLFFTKHAH